MRVETGSVSLGEERVMTGRRVHRLALVAIVALWTSVVVARMPVGVVAVSAHSAALTAHHAAMASDADPHSGGQGDTAMLSGLTGYLLGAGVVLKLIALIRFRARGGP